MEGKFAVYGITSRSYDSNMKKILFYSTLSVIFCCFCSLAGAQIESGDLPNREGINLGPAKVHAAFKTSVRFDSNIFLTSEDEEFDVITMLNPSVGIELPLREHNLSVEYDTAINLFGKNTDQNYVNHRVRGLAEFDFTHFRISVSDMYRYFSDRAGSEDTNRIKRQNNRLRFGIDHEFDQLGYDLGYTFELEDYISKKVIVGDLTYEDKDRLLNIFDAQLSYRFMPKTKALLETYLGFVSYDSSMSSDSWYIETLVGLEGELTSKIDVNFKGGIRHQDYDKADFSASNDFTNFVARGGVRYNMTKDDIIDLNFERSINESTFDRMNYYTMDYVGAEYTHMFTKKISGRVFGGYQWNRYPSEATVSGVTKKRQDHFFSTGTLLRYDIRKWLSIEAKYEYKHRDSNFSAYDFDQHLTTLNGTVGF